MMAAVTASPTAPQRNRLKAPKVAPPAVTVPVPKTM
jgi:hypothetical protein